MKNRLRRILALILCLVLLLPGADALGVEMGEELAWRSVEDSGTVASFAVEAKEAVNEEYVKSGTGFADGSIMTIATDGMDSAVAKRDGSLWVWGADSYSGIEHQGSPGGTPYKLMENIDAIQFGGGGQNAVLKTDGSLWMWGGNHRGQLGNGSTTDTLTPFKLMDNVTAFDLGNGHSAAIKTDGSLWMWGYNASYQLGDGTTTNKSKPFKLMDNVKAVSLGISTSAAIRSDNSLWIWGYPFYGHAVKTQPVKLMDDVKAVCNGWFTSAAIKTDGSLWMWGRNDYGELGNNSTVDSSVPLKVMEDVISVSLGSHHSAAIKTDGSLWMWGYNGSGAFGNGSTESSLVPIKVLDQVNLVALGQYNTIIAKNDGSVWRWGSELDYGGNTARYSNRPVLVTNQVDPISLPSHAGVYEKSACYIRVLNRTDGAVVTGATVTVDGVDYPSDTKGMVQIPGNAEKTVSASISADGYHSRTAGLHLVPGKVRDVLLTPEEKSDDGLKYINCHGYDLLSDAVSAAWESNMEWEISADAIVAASEILLLCDGETIATIAPGGSVRLAASKLKPGKAIWAQVVKADGTKMEAVKTTLSVYESKWLPGTESNFTMQLGPKLSVKLPDDIPLLGGNTFELDWGYLPCAVEIDGDTIRVGVGLEAERDTDPQSPSYGKIKNSEIWENWKKLCDKSKDAKKAIKELDKLGAKKYATSAMEGLNGKNMIDLDISVFGYGEIKMKNGIPESSALEVRALVQAQWYEHTWQTAVWVVPVVIDFELGSKLDARLRGALDFADGSFDSTTALKLTPLYLKPSAGIGLAKVAKIGVYGNGAFVVGFGPAAGYHYGTLDGEAGLVAQFLLWEDEWPFWEDSLPIWEHYPSNAAIVYSNTTRAAAPLNAAGHFSASEFKLANRGYLGAQSGWLSGTRGYNRSSGSGGIRKGQALQSSVYGDTRVRVVRAGADTLMVWLRDNGSRSSENRTELVYSIYDTALESWSEPQPVWNDGTADFLPALATDGSSVYVAWQDSAESFPEGVRVEETAAAGEISLARFDAENKAFVDAQRLTDNDVLDTAPALAVLNGSPHVVWVENAANDMLNQSGGSSLYYHNGETTIEARSGLGPVLDLEAGVMGGAVRIAYTMDEDGSFASHTDQYLYLGTPGDPAMTQMNAGAQNPRFGYMGGEGQFFYLENGALMVSSGGIGTDAGLAGIGGFELIHDGTSQSALLTLRPKAEADGSDIYVHSYTDGAWGAGVQLSEAAGYAENPAGAILDGNTYMAAFIRTDASIGAQRIDTTSDLYYSVLQSGYDIALRDVSYDDAAVGSDAVLQVELAVENTGTLPISGVTASMGESSQSFAQSIAPGETVVLPFGLAMPGAIEPTSYSVYVSPVDGMDMRETDNSQSIMIGYTDLALTLREVGTGAKVGAEIEIENRSRSASGGTLRVLNGGENGAVLGTMHFDTIEGGAVSGLYISGTEIAQMHAMASGDTLYIEASADRDELYTDDNGSFLEIDTSFESHWKTGDADGGGTVNLSDAVRVARIVVGLDTADDHVRYAADVNRDGTVDVKDVMRICRYLVGENSALSASE